jgi:hypothetical protein
VSSVLEVPPVPLRRGDPPPQPNATMLPRTSPATNVWPDLAWMIMMLPAV